MKHIDALRSCYLPAGHARQHFDVAVLIAMRTTQPGCQYFGDRRLADTHQPDPGDVHLAMVGDKV